MLHFRPVTESDVPACIAITEQAFRDDPFFRAVTGGKEKSHHLLLSLLLRLNLKTQTAFLALEGETPVALALVSPPESAALSVGDCLRNGALRAVFSCGFPRVFSALSAMGRFNAACDSLPDPKYNLTLLAVAPSHQGKGVGASLLRGCLFPYLRQKNCPLLCLNTNTRQNCRFYEKNDFTQIAAVTRPIGGIPVQDWSYKIEL